MLGIHAWTVVFLRLMPPSSYRSTCVRCRRELHRLISGQRRLSDIACSDSSSAVFTRIGSFKAAISSRVCGFQNFRPCSLMVLVMHCPGAWAALDPVGGDATDKVHLYCSACC